jgi:hypothetical protein
VRNSTLSIFAMAVLLVGSLPGWTPPERVDRRPADYHTFMPALTVTPDGVSHAVWAEAAPPNYYACKVMYACREGDTWTIPANISRDSGDLRTQVIATDSPGHLVVVWSEEGAARLRYVRRQDDTWSIPKPCFANCGITPRTAVDSRGRIHLIYEDLANPGGIWYSYYESELDTWAAPVRVAQGTSELGWSSLAVDRSDRLHATWMDFATDGLGYSAYDGERWSAPLALPDPSPDDQSCQPGIAVNAPGRPHVAWQERSGGYFIYYTEQAGDTWATPVRVSDQSGGWPAIAADTLGNVHVAWGWGTGLRYAIRTPSGWEGPLVVTDSAGFPGQLVLTGGELHLIWSQTQWAIFYSRLDVSGGLEEQQRLGAMLGLRVPLGRELLLTYTLGETLPVGVSVVDVAGGVVRLLSLGPQPAGTHTIRLDTERQAPGVYFVRVLAGGVSQTQKAIVVK